MHHPSHCEQSWEGDVFNLASPDTGLKATEWEMLRAAHRDIREQYRSSYSGFCP